MATPLLNPVCMLTNQMNLIELEALQAHVASLIKGLTSPKENLLTESQIREEVIKMETRTAYKFTWKRAVNDGLAENVFGILEDSYSDLRLKGNNETSWKEARALGGRHTLKWQQFKIRVIHYLHSNNAFNNNGQVDLFEDTAGGCDEITWDAAIYLLENPEWTHW